MFDYCELPLPGCFEIRPCVLEDHRGRFIKIFHKPSFAAQGLELDFVEEYYSHSHQNVIRGMHFQNPPHDHAKIVYCVHGTVLDVIVDLRLGSPAYGQSLSLILDSQKSNYLYIPKGLAHGFCVLSESATLIYKVSSNYEPNFDTGIAWDSIDIKWPTDNPILSERDLSFVALKNFQSHFVYEG
jgi:dTDP-4-dehydrorhamnose 3,5-epimerase